MEPKDKIIVDGFEYILNTATPKPSIVDLLSLVGLGYLDAVDMSDEQVQKYDTLEDASVCRFRLNGKVYIVVEDPSDGYRSHMRDISCYDGDYPVVNVFPPCHVLVRHRDKGYGFSSSQEDDVLEMVDVKTGKIILEVGTRNTDDYYPSFVASFRPENMEVNK